VTPEADTDANAFTYLLTPQYKFSPDLMAYARLASGYRAGGTNTSAGGIVPADYRPDKTENYELGIKGDFLDRRLTVDASLYDIEWKDLQLQLVNPANQMGYIANGSRARSRGLELSTQLQPGGGLTLASWIVFSDAKLTADFPPNNAYGAAGDRLPLSSRFSSYLSAREEQPLTAAVSGFLEVAVSYVGDRVSYFTDSPLRTVFPAYAKTDVQIGARFRDWSSSLFLDNATDRRGVLSGGLGATPPFAYNYIEPRSFGLSVTRKF
jgi:outer membrane receptor protein involved in Fe transport